MQVESDVAVDAYAMLAGLKFQLGLLEKQIRMLSKLAEGAPLLHHDSELGDGHEKADFVVVDQLRLREIVEEMGHGIKVITIALAAVSEGRV